MGAKKIPAKLKLMAGNPGKRPIPVEPPILEYENGLPLPPEHLNDYAKNEWEKVTVGLQAMGILSTVDEAALAAYCVSFSRWKYAEERLLTEEILVKSSTGATYQNPLIGISNRAAKDMVKFASEFGMTPASRAKLGVKPQKGEKSKFHGLMKAVK